MHLCVFDVPAKNAKTIPKGALSFFPVRLGF